MADKYNIASDRIYFVMGASIAAGRSFWINGGQTGKGVKEQNVSLKISKDGNVGTFKIRGGNSGLQTN